MTTTDELDIITRMRSEVIGRKELTGENLFLAWGYPTAIVLFMEFAALILWNKNWCDWIWVGIPLIGVPLMIYFLNEDYERTHHRTLEANVILMMWIFIGFASCVGGTAMGFAGVFHLCYGLLYDGHRPAFPSEDHLRHHCLITLCPTPLLSGQSLALATAYCLAHSRHRPHHSGPPVPPLCQAFQLTKIQ